MDYSNLKVPNHVAIIVDGNGRWATERGMTRSEGHNEGFLNVKRLSAYIFSKNIKYLSAYLFSTENFKRSKKEVDFLMNLLVGKLKEILEFCHEESIYQDRVFNICFNYGGHAEIIDATKKIVKDVQAGNLNLDKLDEDTYSKYLYQDLPPVDLMIRTSGEQRLSNFMLWQNSYAEFYFPKTYFPDFDEKEFDKAILEYTKRDRRFGGIDYENKNN